jgi:hypothetical protein
VDSASPWALLDIDIFEVAYLEGPCVIFVEKGILEEKANHLFTKNE